MYGRYTKDLGEYAKEEARRLKYHDKARRKYDKTRAEELRKSRRGPLCRKLLALLAFGWKHTGARLGEDWVFLALLGIIMALISYAMDRGISLCNNGQSALLYMSFPVFCDSLTRNMHLKLHFLSASL